jgi:hypothetical protein
MRNKHAPHIDFTDLMIGKLCPSDIDMVLERKGHFLFGEWKRQGRRNKRRPADYAQGAA